MRGFKNFKGSDARCPSIHFLFYGYYILYMYSLIKFKVPIAGCKCDSDIIQNY